MMHRFPHLFIILLISALALTNTLPESQPVTAQSEINLTAVQHLGGRGVPIDVKWSPDGELIAVSSGQGIWLYDPQLEDVRPLELPVLEDLDLFEPLSGGQLAWSPDGTRLAAGSGYFVPSVRGRYAFIWDVTTGEILHQFGSDVPSIEDETAREVAWSADGSQLAGFSRNEWWIWDAETGDEILNVAHEVSLFDDFRWSGNELIVHDNREFKRVKWNATTGELIGAFTTINNSNITSYASSDGVYVAKIDNENASVTIEDEESGEEVYTYEIFSERQFLPIFGLWSSDNSRFIAYIRTRQPEVIVLDVENRRAEMRLELSNRLSIEALGLSPDNQTLVLSTSPGLVATYDVATGEQIKEIWSSAGTLADIDWKPDGTQIITVSSNDTLVRVWDTTSGLPVTTLAGHDGWTFSVDWSPDGTTIATGDGSIGKAFPSTVRLWNAESGDSIAVMPIVSDVEDFGFIDEMLWSPDGSHLAAIRDSNQTGKTSLHVWDASGQNLIYELAPDRARVTPITWSADGRTIISGVMSLGVPLLFDDGTQTESALMWFDVEANDLVRELATSEFTMQLEMQPNGTLIANGQSGRDNRISFLDLAGNIQFETDLLPQRLTALAWHPDGELLATATLGSLVDPIIEIWQIQDSAVVQVLSFHAHLSFGTGITDLAWSADGNYLASSADDGQIIIWELGR